MVLHPAVTQNEADKKVIPKFVTENKDKKFCAENTCRTKPFALGDKILGCGVEAFGLGGRASVYVWWVPWSFLGIHTVHIPLHRSTCSCSAIIRRPLLRRMSSMRSEDV